MLSSIALHPTYLAHVSPAGGRPRRGQDPYPPRPYAGLEFDYMGLSSLAKISSLGGTAGMLSLTVSGRIREGWLVFMGGAVAFILLGWGAHATAIINMDHRFQSQADSADQLILGLRTALVHPEATSRCADLRSYLEERLEAMRDILGQMDDIRRHWISTPFLSRLPICAGRIDRDAARYYTLRAA